MAAKNLDEQDYVSLSTIAKELDCSRKTVARWCDSGALECFIFMGRRLVRRDVYLTFKQKHMVKKVIG